MTNIAKSFVGIDPIEKNQLVVDLALNGESIVDLHNECSLKEMVYDGDKQNLILAFVKDYKSDRSLPIGTEFSVIFDKVPRFDLRIQGEASDLSRFEGIELQDENSDGLKCTLQIGDGVLLQISCESITLDIPSDIVPQ